ncbi:MAG: hypothetical protein V1888_03625 [archaeon]
MNYKKYLLITTATFLMTLSSGCAYYFSPQYREILKQDMKVFGVGDVDQESSRLIKEIKEESLKETKDKW